MYHFQILSRFLSQTIDDALASPLLPLETAQTQSQFYVSQAFSKAVKITL